MRYNSVHMSQNTLRLTRMRVVLTGDYSCALYCEMYKCSLFKSFLNRSLPIPFCVSSVSPLAAIEDPQITVNETDNITITCVATGIPSPDITWQFNMADITIDMTKYIVSTSSIVGSDKNNEVTSELIVTTSDMTDAGNYTCQANNSVRNTSMDSVEVIVQCELCNI